MTRKDLYPIAILSTVILGATLMQSPSGSASNPVAPVASGETQSYECARSLISLVRKSEQPGPLFSSGNLVFTSMDAQNGQPILLVNAGQGNYMLRLEGTGVNRMRFELPSGETGPMKTYFLSYMHGGVLRSRVFEYGEDHAPAGHDELDYSLVHARRADNTQANFDFAIHETAEATLNLIIEGKMSRSQLVPHRVNGCGHIAQQSPTVAGALRRNLDQIDLIVMGPGLFSPGRSIASTGAATRAPASLTKKSN